MFKITLTLLFLLSACAWQPRSNAYLQLYAEPSRSLKKEMEETSHFLIICVNARHLDYTNAPSFIRTLAKHPSDGSKNGDVGHAWIYLRGNNEGVPITIEGGHTGEFGLVQAPYMEGVMDNIEYGCDNPVKYLWETQYDGCFQAGSGKHTPTYAAKINLSPCQFESMLAFIQQYDFCKYSLTGNQCSSFAVQIAKLAGWNLQDKVTMHLPRALDGFTLWTDPCYSHITFSSPDILEKRLKQSVACGEAETALSWYRKHRPHVNQEACLETLKRFPARLYRLF